MKKHNLTRKRNSPLPSPNMPRAPIGIKSTIRGNPSGCVPPICYTNEERAPMLAKQSCQPDQADQADQVEVAPPAKKQKLEEVDIESPAVDNDSAESALERYIKDNFSCPVCLDTKTFYLRCNRDHLICKDCFSKCNALPEGQIRCPTCKTDEIHQQDVAYTVNRMLREDNVSIFGCPHSACPLHESRLSADFIEEHLKECKFREVRCPFRPGSYMCANHCNGTYVPGSLLQHIKECHSKPVLSCGFSMAEYYTRSIEKTPPLCLPHGKHKCRNPSCSVLRQMVSLPVFVCGKEEIASFASGSKARLFVLQVDCITYTVYIACDPKSGLNIVVRGDYPLDSQKANCGRPIRIILFYQEAISRMGETDKANRARFINISKDRAFLDYGAMRIESCPSFTSSVLEEATTLNISDSDSSAQLSTKTGSVFQIPYADFRKRMSRFSAWHFLVQIEFL